jgi:tetratricopeptide (TPR) repeat protein
MKIAISGVVVSIAICLSCLRSAYAQEAPVPAGRPSADTNNAVIEGRVTLPSGLAADINVRITLKNGVSVLSTLYSNKHGEFQFSNLPEGVYYIQAEVPGFESVTGKVLLGRGIVSELTLQLSELPGHFIMPVGARVVSAAELRQQVPAAAKREYNLGLKLVSRGEVEQAAAHFAQAIAIFPEYLAARNDLGAQYLKLKRLDESEQHFRLVLERDPKNFNAKFNLGLVATERRDYLKAISLLEQAIAIDSTRAVAHLWLGFVLLETRDFGAAERELLRALVTGGSECTAAHYHLARAYLERSDTSEALRSLKAYLQESPRGEYAKEAKNLLDELDHKSKREAKR